MAERKAVNKYYPPEWTPEQGSINQFMGQHPLRDRARKLNQGILVIRFEMPFNIWCGGCKAHIAKGVRFNAEKKAIGKYFSTKIWQFRMKCHLCNHWIEIHTDPKICDYVVVSGAQKKMEDWDPEPDEMYVPPEEEVKKKLATDAFYKLEHQNQDEKRKDEAAPRITQLKRTMDRNWDDDYAMSQLLRKKFRDEKKDIAAKEEADRKYTGTWKVAIPLLPHADGDKAAFQQAALSQPKKPSSSAEKFVEKRLSLRMGSIFGGGLTPTAQTRLSAIQKMRRSGIDPSKLTGVSHDPSRDRSRDDAASGRLSLEAALPGHVAVRAATMAATSASRGRDFVGDRRDGDVRVNDDNDGSGSADDDGKTNRRRRRHRHDADEDGRNGQSSNDGGDGRFQNGIDDVRLVAGTEEPLAVDDRAGHFASDGGGRDDDAAGECSPERSGGGTGGPLPLDDRAGDFASDDADGVEDRHGDDGDDGGGDEDSAGERLPESSGGNERSVERCSDRSHTGPGRSQSRDAAGADVTWQGRSRDQSRGGVGQDSPDIAGDAGGTSQSRSLHEEGRSRDRSPGSGDDRESPDGVGDTESRSPSRSRDGGTSTGPGALRSLLGDSYSDSDDGA